MSETSLTGRVAVVTGGGAGIGAAIASALRAAGAEVEIFDIDPAAGGDVVDVADIAATRAALDRCHRRHGRLDILVNNAAQGGGGAIETVTEAVFDRLFAVNAKGAFFASQAAAQLMKQNAFGRIVNISSLIGVRGKSVNSHYAGAKAALAGFTRSWALELAPHGVTVNTVVVALTATPMTLATETAEALATRGGAVPMGRLATPEDAANLVGFLCSPAAGFVTGQLLSANGAEYVGPM